MGKGYIAIIALALTAVGVVGAAILEEDFDGTTFPPDGWSIIIDNLGLEKCEWERVNRGGGNYCARAHLYGYYGDSGRATLVTKSIYLTGAPTCVSFMYNSRSDGGLSYVLYVQLRRGTAILWHDELPHSANWSQVRANVPAYTSADYEIGWDVYGFHASIHAPPGNAYFYLDDIVIEENTAVGATSLGRVRALYR